MSVTGRTPQALQVALRASVVGQTLTAGTDLAALALTAADDDQDPTRGPRECADGGVAVRYLGGATTGGAAPQTTGGLVQRMWRHRFRVRVTYALAGVTGDRIAVNLLAWGHQLVNLIEAGLEPSSGTNYTVTALELYEPVRHATNLDFFVQDLDVTLVEPWARS